MCNLLLLRAGSPRRVRAVSVRRARRGIGLAGALLGLAVTCLPAPADVVILKDGYALHGKVVKESAPINDKEAGFVNALKPNGLTFVDDGARWTVFSAHQRQVGDVQKDVNKFAEHLMFHRKPSGVNRSPFPQDAVMSGDVPQFNKAWQRELTFLDSEGRGNYIVRQRITTLTPHFVRIDSPTHMWNCGFLTQELGPAEARRLLRFYPELEEKDGQPDADKRMKIARFLIQAGWYDDAEAELAEIVKLLPAEKERVEKARAEIAELLTDRRLAEIERAREAGRHDWVRQELQAFSKANPPAKMVARLASLQAEYDALFKQFDSAKRLLGDLIPKVQNAELAEAGRAVLNELHPESVGRIETFVTLAEQAERDAKQGRKVLQIPEELVSAAVSGWLLGKNSAETKPASALKGWRAREMTLKYQREPSFAGRRKILADFQQNRTRLEFDELGQLVSLLPPAEPETDLPPKPTLRKTGSLPRLPGGVNYLLQLPPEYKPGRSYPVLIILPAGGQKVEQILRGFGNLPSRYGYIVAVLEWHQGFQNTYDFGSPEPHAMLTGLVRHLKRKFQVDSDRVFLFGVSEGASMAMEVATAHPDLFAGVMPMNPFVSWWVCREYWRNLQQLPLYLITGDMVGKKRVDQIRMMIDQIMPKGYPALMISYMGRGVEWFGAELPYMFDWMSRKKRAGAVPDVGRFAGVGNEGQEYRTMRQTDSRFYWLSTESIGERHLLETSKTQQMYGAALQASILEGNVIHVRTRGVDDVTVWLGRGMVDFEKPVRIKVNHSGYWDNGRKPITPDLSVLMEDLYERADRQRPYFYKVAFKTTP